MGDRESDIYELFLEAAKEPGPGLLVRSERSRNRKVDQEFLWDFMAGRHRRATSKSTFLIAVPVKLETPCWISGLRKWNCVPRRFIPKPSGCGWFMPWRGMQKTRP